EKLEKIMAMDDSMILPYFELATDVPMEEIEGMRIRLRQGENPKDLKMRLAHTIVATYISPEQADKAQENFINVFQNKNMPTDMPVYNLPRESDIVSVLLETGLASSKSEARRLIGQKAVKIDGVVVDDVNVLLKGTKQGIVLQKGKRHFVKLTD
ncbi:MAG: tyrosine--tRNA ligase, partial [Bacteroidetes bacterium]